MILEACVESYLEAESAQIRGANRIELCENLAAGGTTPSYGTIKQALKGLTIPVLVMIRPRGGDFVYSFEEIEIMRADIEACKTLGVTGVVFGVLTPAGAIDYPLLSELMALAKPMAVTFHKAIDEVADPVSELPKLSALRVDRILTSGKAATALEGQALLREMLAHAAGRIEIVCAGKVTHDNLHEVQQVVPARAFHGKKIV